MAPENSREEETPDAAASIDQPEEIRKEVFEEAKARFDELRQKAASERTEDEWEDALYEVQVSWLRYKWGVEGRAPDCPYCGIREWRIGPPVSVKALGHYRSPPFFPVGCSNCGHTTLISSEVADLNVDDEEGET